MPIRRLLLSVGIAALGVCAAVADDAASGNTYTLEPYHPSDTQVEKLVATLSEKPIKTDVYNEYDNGVYVVKEDYYRQFSYQWTDGEGKVHTSNLLERATSRPQILALLKEVYTNPCIPGFTYDHSVEFAQTETDELYTLFHEQCGTTKSDKTVCTNYRNPTVTYAPYTGAPYNMDAETPVQTPIQGMTALLVEMNEDFKKNCLSDTSDPDLCLDAIKAVSVIPKQFYVSRKSGSALPGFILNVEGVINRCFVMMKGNLRVSHNPTPPVPFRGLFEECSPSNENPVFNMRAELEAGKQFKVDHVCGTVIGQYHDMVMAKDRDSYEEYPTNMLFYVPDWRFRGDTRHSDASKYDGEFYTYYPDGPYRPYFLTNHIKATIATPVPYEGHEGQMLVPITWTSEYKNITKTPGAPEEYFVYRVIGDVIQPEPVPSDQLVWTIEESDKQSIDPFTEGEENGDNQNGRIHDALSPTVTLSVIEDVKADPREVTYIIWGRRENSPFSFTESNMVTTELPGTDHNALRIKIDGDDLSECDIETQNNSYTNTIALMPDDDLTFGEVREGSVFTLFRYIEGDEEEVANRVKVGTMEVTKVDYQNEYNQYVYTVRFEDGDGNDITKDLDEKHTNGVRFKAVVKDVPESKYNSVPLTYLDTEGDVEQYGGNGKHRLAWFDDKFTASTANGNHPANYSYRMFLETPAATTGGEATTTHSNLVEVPVIKREVYVGYKPYSLSEIEEDLLRNPDDPARLRPNEMVVAHEVKRNNNIAGYEIWAVNPATNISKRVARSVRGNAGQFARYVRDASGKMVYDDRLNPMTIGGFQGLLVYRFPDDEVIDPASDFAIMTLYKNGSSYGNDRKRAVERPTVEITPVRMVQGAYRQDGTNEYECEISWAHNTLGGTYDFHADAVFARLDCDHNFGEWYQQGQDAPAMAAAATDSGEDTPPTYSATYVLGHNAVPLSNHEVSATHTVRTYFAAPANALVAENGGEGYVIADAQATNGPVVTLSGIENVAAEAADGEPVYYDLHGVRVNPADIPAGVYIRVCGTKAEKILIK